MEQTIKQRLISFIKFKGLTQRSFSRMIGLPETFISSMRNSTSADKLNKIFVQFPELNKTWLLTGEGDMLTPAEVSAQLIGSASSALQENIVQVRFFDVNPTATF